MVGWVVGWLGGGDPPRAGRVVPMDPASNATAMKGDREMNQTLRIGSGAAWWGDRVEPAALNAEHGALDYLCFETMAEATGSAAQVRLRRESSFAGYDTYLHARMRPARPRLAHRATAARFRPAWAEGGGGLRQPDHRSRAGTARPRAGKRRARALARARSDQCRGLPRRRAYRRRLARRRADRGHPPRCRPVDLPGADDAWVRLGSAGPRARWRRQRHRPSAGMRRPGDRWLLLRPRLQGTARTLELRLPDCRGAIRWHGGDHQGRGQWRRRHATDDQGADAVRGA